MSQITSSVVENTFGACLIGAQISAIFYGFMTLQSYVYFVSYPEDPVKNKVLVSILWFLDSIHTAIVTTTIYHYLVTNYHNPAALASADWSFDMEFAINIVVECIVRTFFATQIFRLASSRVRWWLTSIIGVSIIANLFFGIATLVLTITKKEFTKFKEPEISLYSAMPFAVFRVFSDFLITGSLCVLLHGSRTVYRRMNRVLTTLIVYAVNRCLLTSVVAVVEEVMFLAKPNTLWYLTFDLFIGKLYSNSLLASLNSRQAIKAKAASAVNVNSIHLGNNLVVEPTDLASNSQPKTDNEAFVLDIHAGSISRSSGTQSHLSAKDKMSAVAPYTHGNYDYRESHDST